MSTYRNRGRRKGYSQRVARLFFTSYDYESPENIASIELIKDFLEDNVEFKKTIIDIGINYLGYGNAFIGLYLPFKRWVKCPTCEKSYAAERVDDLAYNPDGYFEGNCVCGAKSTRFSYRDTPDKDINKIHIINFNPKEIDIIARENDRIVFVEVKTRKNTRYGSPVEAVNMKKQKHIVDAAEEYIEKNNIELETRFDIISIIMDREKHGINHIKEAFHPAIS